MISSQIKDFFTTKARKNKNTKKIADRFLCSRGAHAAQALALRERLRCALQIRVFVVGF
jgi:hypothetical protein